MALPIKFIDTTKQEEINQIDSINDDFFLLQLLLEEKLELALVQQLKKAKAKMFKTFRSRFIPNYEIEKEAFAQFMKFLSTVKLYPEDTFDRRPLRVHCDEEYLFKFKKLPPVIKQRLEKQTGSIPENVIEIVSQINDDPFSNALINGAFEAMETGGNAAFTIFEINSPFDMRDENVEKFIQNHEIQLAKAITDQISSDIRFEIIEGECAGSARYARKCYTRRILLQVE